MIDARPPLDPEERARLVRRAKLLAWGGNAWHFAAAVAAKESIESWKGDS